MRPLEKTLRNQLERIIKDARDIAEDAARAVLEQLGVNEATPFSQLSNEERELRRKLRVHGRQLGDPLNGGKTQKMDRLIEEIAYEHWHRMLFARFLAENNLLMYPDPTTPVSVTLVECEDLAAEEGAANGWELAARFAASMLPQIFRKDSPVFLLNLPPEYQQKLERLVARLPLEVFTASDSLGWVYQFWQAKKKNEINLAEIKIGARELPAVTQLFTEPYMVSFLLDNSLGAWWAARRLNSFDFNNALSEEELRNKAAIPGLPLDYLRFIQKEDGCWVPAAGTFNNWPKQLCDLKILDPCCGSGHFLVAVFLMLVPMRMKEDNLSAQEAVDVVLSENIHGVELDQRCVELAAFALALTAWKYPGTCGYRLLPELNLACSGLSVSIAKEEWKKLGLGKRNLTIALDWIYETFQQAPVLGSLFNPTRTDAVKILQWDELSNALKQALKQEQNDEQQEVAVVAHGLAKSATLLSGHYHLVVTNVPYLASGKQIEQLQEFCKKYYPEAKNDLATVFLERCLELCDEGGTTSIVLPQNWLFLSSYKKFREKLLRNDTWHLFARLGEGGFDSSAAAGAFVAMISISRGNTSQEYGELFRETKDNNFISGMDVMQHKTATEKATGLLTAEIQTMAQVKQLNNPDARITLDESANITLLEKIAYSYKGITSGDDLHYRRFFWEFSFLQIGFEFFQSTVKTGNKFGGHESVIWLNNMTNPIKPGVYIRATEALNRKGIMISQMRELPAALYLGGRFDTNAAALVPLNKEHLIPIWCFCSSPEYNKAVRKIDQKINVTNATLVKIPFDLEHWSKIAKEKYPNGLPKPYSNDPSQSIFHGHPCGSVEWNEEKKWTDHGTLRCDATVLQVAVARLLGFRWPSELDTTIELAEEQIEWVKRSDNLLSYAVNDGIVCIPPLSGELSASDRLLNLIAAAYGDSWSNDILLQVLKNADNAGKNLETWLRDKFFIQHCKLFQHRPFIWHIWDGLNDGFSALLNYHKLNAKLLETLIYTYLGDWISRQKQDVANSIDCAQERLAAAEKLKRILELILEGEAPYDIFVRWKSIEKQSVGWSPDLSDGIRLNIRPFLSVPSVGKKGAGILREKPNINWNKDRGKDVQSEPWYDVFNGERINDHHLSLKDKLAAREAIK